jgi:V/A-type H+-transporting ATPase subunit I
MRQRIADIDARLAELSRAHAATVAALRAVLRDRVAEADVLDAAAGSEHLVVLSGWIPKEHIQDLRASLARDIGDRAVVVSRTDVEDAHTAPVALANSGLAHAFEPLARFAAVPRYGTVDPTPLLAITFPAFVGLMLGDAGYGLALLLLLLVLRGRLRRSPRARPLWSVGLTVAISTIAFGLLFGELFGETGRHLLGLPVIWLDRREAILPLLIATLAIGVAQVALGLGLGVVNASLLEHRREAVGRGALLMGLASGVVLLSAGAGVVPPELAVLAAAALIAALVIALLSMGVAGPLELVGVMASVLSYARLMAIGLAGVMIALIADTVGGLLPNVVFGVLVAVLLHALNLMFGLFDASVQGLRLHYVEFFSKFLESGGTPYAPFSSALASASGITGGR